MWHNDWLFAEDEDATERNDAVRLNISGSDMNDHLYYPNPSLERVIILWKANLVLWFNMDPYGIAGTRQASLLTKSQSPPMHTKLGSKYDMIVKQQIMPGIDFFVAYASWKKTAHQSLRTWSSTNLHLYLGEGSGQRNAPFCVTSDEFVSICNEIGFSQPFLRKLFAKAPIFEYRFDSLDSSGSSTAPSHLEIAMANYENDSFFCLFRYNINERTSPCMLFLKVLDRRRESESPLLPDDLLVWLVENEEMLQRNPLLILNIILQFVQYEAQEYVRGRLELYNLESRLGVTREGEYLKQGGYGAVDFDFTLLNADLAGVVKKMANTELSTSVIVDHAKSLHRLVGLCEDFEALKSQDKAQAARPIVSEQREEIQSTIIRGELYLKNIKMTQDVLQSLSAVLYNRINKQDSDSMKTIAVVTLVFLPATFVSAIFSTGIFNFHASESPDQPRTVSKYGWVYLLVCLLSTSLTLLSWVCWYRWGRVWLEKLKFSSIYDSTNKSKASASV